MTQHCTITGTMLVPVHYIICTLKIVFFPEITVFVVVKINSFQCQCQCQKAGGLDNTNKSRLFANPGLKFDIQVHIKVENSHHFFGSIFDKICYSSRGHVYV